MPLTIESRNELITLVVGMFNAPPGSAHLNALANVLQSGKTMLDITRILAARPEFTEAYPALGADEFSDRLASNLLGGEVSTATAAWAKDWVKSQLAAGVDKASVIFAAVHALQASTNPDFANAKVMLANKVDVALYYSLTGFGSTSLTTLQAVLDGVTSKASTVIASKAAIITAIVDYAFRGSYELTTGADVIKLSDHGVGLIYGNGSNLLSAGDSIDGGPGIFKLNLSSTNKIDVPASVTVSKVEVANLVSAAGVTADVSGWSGLTALNVTSTAGDVVIKAASTTAVKIVVGGTTSTSATPVNVDINGGGLINITTDSSVLTTIANPHAGVRVNFSPDGNISFTVAKVSLAAGAVLQDYLNAAAAGAGSPYTLVKWFQYDGNTYLVADNSAASTYVNGADTTVKLIGLVDLGAATFSAVVGKSASFTLA